MSSEYRDLRLPTPSQLAAAKQARREARAAKRQAKLQRELERQSYAVVNVARRLSGSVGSQMRRLSAFLSPREPIAIDVAPSEDESTPRPSSRILSTWKPNLTTHQRRTKTEIEEETSSSDTDDEDTPRTKRKPTSPRHSIPSRMLYIIIIIIILFIITLYLGMSANEDDEMSAMQRWTHSVIKMTIGNKNATAFSIPSSKSSSESSSSLSIEPSTPTPRTRARWIPPSTPASFAPKYPLPAPSWPTPPAKMCTGSLIFRTWALLSPNGKLDVVIEWTRPTIQDGYRAVGLWLTMYHEKRRILKPSRLELDVEDLIDVTPDSEGQHYDMSQSLLHHQQTSTSDTWHPTIPHEKRSYTMRCNILNLVFKKQHSEKTKSIHTHKLKKEYTFRACDTGFAWRSTLHDIDDTVRPSTERHEMIHATTLRWNGDTSSIHVWGSWQDEPYRMYALNDTIPLLPVPLTLHIPSPDLYITLAQSGGLSFTTTTINSISSSRAGCAMGCVSCSCHVMHACTLYMHTSGSITNLPISTPWHVMIIATTPMGLHDNNRMIPMLNDETQLEDKSVFKWLRPGHNIRISSFTTHEVEQWLEWAYKHQSHITMIQLPEGWYGDTSGPQHATSVDPSHALSLDDVVASAQAQSVSIQVYVTDVAMNSDDLPRIYYDYHITSVVADVMNEMNIAEISSFHHHMITFGHKHIMFDTHTSHYRPRGLHRTYPHMIGHGTSMSGSSHPSADDHVMMPFVTGIQGPVQYQYRYRDPNNKVTIAHLLALNIILFTPFPLHTDTFSVATNDVWFIFAMSIPTIWSDTRIISMILGEYVSVARLDVEQHTWYIGTITNNDAREIELDLSFLDASVHEWEIHGYTDDEKPVNRASQQGVRPISMTLTHDSLKLTLNLRGSGGHVIAITPKS